jgi:hypothetical protein
MFKVVLYLQPDTQLVLPAVHVSRADGGYAVFGADGIYLQEFQNIDTYDWYFKLF